MENKFTYKIKRHIGFCAYEKLWIILTLLMGVSVFFMVRGSTVELLIDTQFMRVLFCSDVNGDKTVYNISISFFAAYIFYILQVYYPERSRNISVLKSTALDTYNFVNQTLLFLFVWEKLVNVTSDGTIVNVNNKKFYYKSKMHIIAHEADIDELKKITGRVQDEYQKVINNLNFSKCDENIYTLFKEMDIAKEINKLMILALSANSASENCATIFETYSPQQVKLIKIKMELIRRIYGFGQIGDFEETTDQKEIARWEQYKAQADAWIQENMEFFRNLPEGYDEVIK